MGYDRRNNENQGNQMALITGCLQALSEEQTQLTEKLTALEEGAERRHSAILAVLEAFKEQQAGLAKALDAHAEERNDWLHTAIKMILKDSTDNTNVLLEKLTEQRAHASLLDSLQTKIHFLLFNYREWNRRRLQRKLAALQKAVEK